MLFAVLWMVSLLVDPNGYLSTDTGGKTAALVALERNGGADLDLGYWAEAHDPDGSLFPMFSTRHFDDGGWVNATTLPMLYVAAPLHQAGGMRAALVLPVLGSVAAALAAGALARRLARRQPEHAAAAATVVVGLAGPATVYALDFWEHSIGLALMGWAMVGVHDALERASRSGHLAAFAAGAGFGAAATMRQEALVYGFVAGLALLAIGWARNGPRIVTRGGAMVLGTLVPLAANAMLERAVLGSASRADRGFGTAAAAGSDLGLRVEEAFVTGFGSSGSLSVLAIVSGVFATAGLAGLGLAGGSDGRRRSVALVAVGFAPLVLSLLALGLRFVPGMVFATPLAGLGFAAMRRPAAADRAPLAVAIGAMPLVWAVQYTGGAGPQWAGRYILLSGFLLTVVAVSRFWADRREVVAGVAGLGLAVTLAGVAWTVQRADAFAGLSAELAAAPEPVLVFSDPFVSREAGPIVLDEQWLAAWTDERRALAGEVVVASGHDEFGYVNREREPDVPIFAGFRPVSERFIEVFDGYRFRVTTFVAEP